MIPSINFSFLFEASMCTNNEVLKVIEGSIHSHAVIFEAQKVIRSTKGFNVNSNIQVVISTEILLEIFSSIFKLIGSGNF